MTLESIILDAKSQLPEIQRHLLTVADYFILGGRLFPEAALLLGDNWYHVGHVFEPTPEMLALPEFQDYQLCSKELTTGEAVPHISLETYLDPLVQELKEGHRLALLPFGHGRKTEAERLRGRIDRGFYFEARYKNTDIYVFPDANNIFNLCTSSPQVEVH